MKKIRELVMHKQEIIDMIIKECHKMGIKKPEAIQYILATVEHETAGTFKPVRESYWVRDKLIERYGLKKGAKRFEKWAKANFRYYPYYGRGLVQLTWKQNYEKFSKILTEMYFSQKIDIVKHPDMVLDVQFSIKILVYGMKHGIFTGKKIEDYFGESGSNFIGARRIINGTDKAKKIAAIAQAITIG